jgi:hypothetical protein
LAGLRRGLGVGLGVLRLELLERGLLGLGLGPRLVVASALLLLGHRLFGLHLSRAALARERHAHRFE